MLWAYRVLYGLVSRALIIKSTVKVQIETPLRARYRLFEHLGPKEPLAELIRVTGNALHFTVTIFQLQKKSY